MHADLLARTCLQRPCEGSLAVSLVPVLLQYAGKLTAVDLGSSHKPMLLSTCASTLLILLRPALTVQAPCDLPEDASFEEYLATDFPEDDVRETFIDPLSLKGAPKAMSRDYPDEVRLQPQFILCSMLARCCVTVTSSILCYTLQCAGRTSTSHIVGHGGSQFCSITCLQIMRAWQRMTDSLSMRC